ncbi:MAG: DUF58 domain-containing protein [Butyrivibrio sp.]|nr:DUF58 domain-containing protein [Butyrivibrio sp.]
MNTKDKKVETLTRIRPDYEVLAPLGARINFKNHDRSACRTDGGFASVYRGQSMELEDLRPYVYGDNLRDVDWKATSRTGEIMIRNYTADKRKQIIFVGDSGINMEGDMPDGSSKKECELITIGTAAYLAGRGGADYSIVSPNAYKQKLGHYGSGSKWLEQELGDLQNAVFTPNKTDIGEVLNQILDLPMRGVAICLVTDLYGLYNLDERLLRTVANGRDFYVFQVSDVDWGGKAFYNARNKKRIPEFMTLNRKLARQIKDKKDEYQKLVRIKLRRAGTFYAYLEDLKEIPETVAMVLNGEITD